MVALCVYKGGQPAVFNGFCKWSKLNSKVLEDIW